MRRTLALVSLAVTTMIALGVLIPCALIVRDLAGDRVVIEAQRRLGTLVAVTAAAPDRPTVERAVAVSRPRAVVVFADGSTVGGGPLVTTTQALAAANGSIAAAGDGSAGDRVVLQAVYTRFQGAAVVQVRVSDQAFPSGVIAAWTVMGAVAVFLLGCSVFTADRLGARMVGAARRLGHAAGRLGAGDLQVRVVPEGPRELRDTAFAFNSMADRVARQIAAERRTAADLSHRLRTPLTALRLHVDRLGEGEPMTPTRQALARLEQETDLLIQLTRRSEDGSGAATCDAAEVVRERMGFWSVLADDQNRRQHLTCPDDGVPVPVGRGELAAALDALLGNVFHHTPEGTAFAVTLQPGIERVGLLVSDAGPGIADPDSMARRGNSGGGSTGLGLDIVRRLAESTGGEMRVDRSVMGGAHVSLWLRVHPSPP
jgi:signal transduction histidine kinase